MKMVEKKIYKKKEDQIIFFFKTNSFVKIMFKITKKEF